MKKSIVTKKLSIATQTIRELVAVDPRTLTEIVGGMRPATRACSNSAASNQDACCA